MKQEHALVVFSGGMDSATALWWAMREFETVSAVSFSYGSKHNARELAAAAASSRALCFAPYSNDTAPTSSNLLRAHHNAVALSMPPEKTTIARCRSMGNASVRSGRRVRGRAC
jgi:adenylyl- and sulfurtransferase ThiI